MGNCISQRWRQFNHLIDKTEHHLFCLGMSQHNAQGTSLAMMLPPIGVMAVYNYYKAGAVDFKVAAILCVSFVAGSFFGSKIALSLSPEQVKKAFGIFIILLGLKMVFWE